MPLLKNEPFEKEQPPKDLDPNEEVFFCPTTLEIFRDYDEFFDRTILVNSVVWSCSTCNKADLTYQEALDCAASDAQQISAYSIGLARGLLWLASRCYQSNIKMLTDDVLSVARDRYFLDEDVEFFTHGQKTFRAGTVTRVVNVGGKNESQSSTKVRNINGTQAGTANGNPSTKSSKSAAGTIDLTNSDDESTVIEIDDDDEEDEIAVSNMPEPMSGYYVIREKLDKSSSGTPGAKSKGGGTFFVPAVNLRRPKGIITRDAVKFFLRHTCESRGDIYTVKPDFAKKYRLDSTKWSHLFAGPAPKFTNTSKPRTSTSSDISRKNKNNEESLASLKKRLQEEQSKKVTKKVSQTPPTQSDSQRSTMVNGWHQGDQPDKGNYANPGEMARAQEAALVAMRAQEAARREAEKLAKIQEREQKREERRTRVVLEQEWTRHREDLDILNLQPLPQLEPVETSISGDQFGDALCLLEFIHTFSGVFNLTSNLASSTISLAQLEKCLLDNDPNGMFTDIVFAFLTALQAIDEEEGDDEPVNAADLANDLLSSPIKLNTPSTITPSPSAIASPSAATQQLIRHCISSRKFPQLVLGQTEGELTLDALTLTEMLRLRLLSAGGRALQSNWASRCPGAQSTLDEPGLAFIKQYPHIMEKLETDNVYDLSVSDKLRLLTCLMEQLLTSLSAKEAVDANFETIRQLRSDMRQLQMDVCKAERDLAALRWSGKHKIKKTEEEGSQQPEVQQLATFFGPNGTSLVMLAPGVTQEDYKETLQRLNEIKENAQLKEKELIISVFQASGGCQMMCLGQDRAYRRYWILRAVPGLFVEDSKRNWLPQMRHHVTNGGETASSNGECSLAEDLTCALQIRYRQAPFGEQINFDTCPLDKLRSVVKSEKVDFSRPDDYLTQQHLTNPAVAQMENLRKHRVPWTFLAPLSPDELPDISAEDESQPSKAKSSRSVGRAAVDRLLASLHLSGYRESGLYRSIQEVRPMVDESVERSCVETLTHAGHPPKKEAVVQRTSARWSNVQQQKALLPNQTACHWLEMKLRESILDLEDRLFCGGLGYFKDNLNRASWRLSIETLEPIPCAPEDNEELPDPDTKKAHEDQKRVTVVKELSMALLQVAEGISSKYIVAPLGDDDEQTKAAKLKAQARVKLAITPAEEGGSDTEESDEVGGKGVSTWERWLFATGRARSLSQLHLHLGALEQSVRWAKSLLKTYCRVCRRKGDDNKLLLCDVCDGGYHMYCLKPRITKVPQGEWYCPRCVPTPVVKKKRKVEEVVKEESEEEEEEEEKEEEEESSGDEEVSSAEEEEDVKSSEGEKENEVVSSKSRAKAIKLPATTAKSRAGKAIVARSSSAATSKSRPSSTPKMTEAPSRSRTSLPGPCLTTTLSRKRGNAEAQSLKTCEDLVDELLTDKTREDIVRPFRDPVNKRQVPDYAQYVTHPMDLTTIKVKINKFKYQTAAEIISDLRLIISNCELYNRSSSEEYRYAQKLKRHLDTRLRQLGLESVEASPSSSQEPPKKRTRTR